MAFTATREEGGELGHRGAPPQLHRGDPREERGSRRGGGRRAWASRAQIDRRHRLPMLPSPVRPPPALLAAAGGTSSRPASPLLPLPPLRRSRARRRRTSSRCRRPLLAWLACPCVEAARGHGGAEAAAPELPPGRIRLRPWRSRGCGRGGHGVGDSGRGGRGGPEAPARMRLRREAMHPSAFCLTRWLFYWRRRARGTVASARQKCECLTLLKSV